MPECTQVFKNRRCTCQCSGSTVAWDGWMTGLLIVASPSAAFRSVCERPHQQQVRLRRAGTFKSMAAVLLIQLSFADGRIWKQACSPALGAHAVAASGPWPAAIMC